MLLSFVSFHVVGQNVQWASQVLDVSSEFERGFFFNSLLTNDKYPAEQALGRPNVLPNNAGDNPNAWVPAHEDQMEYIKVGFNTPMKIQQVAIAESFNPSAVYQIFGYDENDKEYLLNTLSPAMVPLEGRLLNVIFRETTFEVHAIKIVLNESVTGYSGIDAIGISSSPVPIRVEINVAANINEDLVIEKLSAKINSQNIDLNPIVAPDGKIMYFSRDSPENVGGPSDNEDIWYTEYDPNTGEWAEAQNIGQPLNNKGSNFVSSIALDGDDYILLLGNVYKKKDKMEAGVSISRQTGEGWSQPEAMQIDDFYNISPFANYFLSADQRYLLMSVEREDSKGSRDLYVSFPRDDGTWTEPMNLGDDINTAEVESSPFLAIDDTTLFFSSKGYSGYGGDDVFVSYRLDDTWQNWSEPENLGSIINSELDDTFFTISLTNEFAYLTRRSPNEADMYEMRLPIFREPEIMFVLRGKVLNKDTNEPLGASVVIDDVGVGEIAVSTRTQADPTTGEYEITLPAGQYEIHPELNNFSPEKEEILNFKKDASTRTITQNLYLVVAPVASREEGEEGQAGESGIVADLTANNKAMMPNQILFDYDQTIIRATGYNQLDALAEFMKNNETVQLEVIGYTDAAGPSSYNQGLSERRAQAVLEFLLHKGIAANRIKAMGKGEADPVSNNSTEEGRGKNRRVEFVIKNILIER